ncbi:MAG: ArsR/SmtB family transcription factor [Bacillota bacterium]
MKRDQKQKSCEICEIYSPDKKIVELLKNQQLDDQVLQNLSSIFKTIGDPTRLKIINALRKEELCVCDLSELLEMSSSAISHQLRVLRNNNLVKYRKEGRSVYYSLDDEHVLALFSQGLQHVLEKK